MTSNLVRIQPLGFNVTDLLPLLAARNLQGILLTSPASVYYTTGLPTLPGSGNPILHALQNQLPFSSYISSQGDAALLCWVGATFGIEFSVPEVRTFFDWSSANDELREFLQAKLMPGVPVGVEATCPLYVVRMLEQMIGGASICVADDLILGLRLRKSEQELALIKRATEIVEKSVLDLSSLLTPGLSRLNLIKAAKHTMLMNGATGVDHTTIAFGSSNPEIACDELLLPNQLVTMDLGAVVDGYVSDNRRLFFTGSIPPSLRTLHDKLCSIVERMGRSLRPGTSFSALYDQAIGLYEAEGLPPLFLIVGHSLGLQTEEAWIVGGSPHVVQPGMVLNLELYVPYDTGEWVGDEETYQITEAGPVRLTRLDPGIRSVGF